MKQNYVIYHLHSDLSLLDSATKFEKYLDKAADSNMKSIAFSEHGSVFQWIKKKQECEKRGLKYIHAQEFYITESLNERIRDNYHTILIARNWEGVKELNLLSSIGYRRDGHYYYDPRITIDELINTSDNILITTACLASPLWKGRDRSIYHKYLNFLIKNKHRCWLEIQYHNTEDQKEYNKKLYELHKRYSIPLIVGTDTHALDRDYLEARRILLQAKGIKFTNEEEYDLTFKTYSQLVQAFEEQEALSEEVYLQAIENTNIMADTIEFFELDTTHKYPKVENDSENVFKQKINQGVKNRGINKFSKEKRDKYYKVIKEEFEVYKKLNAIDYMLLQEDIISWAKKNKIEPGYGRGSVNGSLIAYVLGITEMDSIKHNLNFFRFLNPSRVTMPDIDVDFPPSRRREVVDYIATKENIFFSEIITFNTIALKGSIRDVGRALGYDLYIIDEIAKNIEINEDVYRKKYPDLFRCVDLLNGTNTSVGSHPSGFLVSPIALDENVGTFYTNESKYPVSQVNMRELESVNFVKLDVLGLDNIEIINETCRLANIERLTPDNVDDEDSNVWESIKENSLAIFQMEGDFAHSILKNTLNSIDIIKEKNPDIKRIDILSMVNGAIRPSGDSFRDSLSMGKFKDNEHRALNKFLSSTMGYCIYQEQIMQFLVEFCGFSAVESDTVRRGLSKKTGTYEFLPAIRKGFIETMVAKYGETEGHAEEILQSFLSVIEDASSYGFSVNHSCPYSYIAYSNGYLRYYYPLEFITVLLNINSDKKDKTAKVIDYANSKGIKILPIKFRKSKAEYNMDKSSNSIYQGISSVKHCNEKIAEELFNLGKNNYNSFLDLLIDIKEISVRSDQLNILTKLNFFSEFGNNKKLLNYIDIFNKYYGKKQFNKDKMDSQLEDVIKLYCNKETPKQYREFDSYKFLRYMWKQIPNEILPLNEQLDAEKEYLGYCQTTIPESKYDLGYVLEVNTKYTPRLLIYDITDGSTQWYKIKKSIYNKSPIEESDIVYIAKTEQKNKMRKIDNQWVRLDELEWHITDYIKTDPNKLTDYITNL